MHINYDSYRFLLGLTQGKGLGLQFILICIYSQKINTWIINIANIEYDVVQYYIMWVWLAGAGGTEWMAIWNMHTYLAQSHWFSNKQLKMIPLIHFPPPIFHSPLGWLCMQPSMIDQGPLIQVIRGMDVITCQLGQETYHH